jgi:hypothetical protein
MLEEAVAEQNDAQSSVSGCEQKFGLAAKRKYGF